MLKHKKALRSILSLLLIVYLVVVTPVSAFAESWDDSLIETTTTSEVIIGESDVIPQPRIPNWLVLDWDATATQVIISVQNVGVDTVDICSGTVYVENVYAGSFTITNITPLSTRTATVNTSMKKCYENIVVNYYGVDGGTEFAEGSSPGHREIPSSLSSIWQQGSFSTTYASINYHFSTHGAEVGTTNIVDYATKAKNYRNSVISDISSLTSSALNSRYTITVSNGATIAHKYKHKTNSQFIILSDVGYYIISYGK